MLFIFLILNFDLFVLHTCGCKPNSGSIWHPFVCEMQFGQLGIRPEWPVASHVREKFRVLTWLVFKILEFVEPLFGLRLLLPFWCRRGGVLVHGWCAARKIGAKVGSSHLHFLTPLLASRDPVGHQFCSFWHHFWTCRETAKITQKHAKTQQKKCLLNNLAASRQVLESAKLVRDWIPTGCRLDPDWIPTGQSGGQKMQNWCPNATYFQKNRPLPRTPPQKTSPPPVLSQIRATQLRIC